MVSGGSDAALRMQVRLKGEDLKLVGALAVTFRPTVWATDGDHVDLGGGRTLDSFDSPGHARHLVLGKQLVGLAADGSGQALGPARSTVACSKCRPMICAPTGSPPSPKPVQTVRPGCPVRLKGMVKFGASKLAHFVICSIGRASPGCAADSSRSQDCMTFATSSQSSRRRRWAWM